MDATADDTITKADNTTLDEALNYAAHGWQAFPLKPSSKLPATPRSFYDATSNPATLRRWFAQGYPYNVGVRSGVASGVFILDIDGDRGAASLRELELKHGRLSPTLTSTTGKGHHYWFLTNNPVPSSIGRIAPGIDIRGDGGYVVAPPSIHPNGRVYRWVDYSIPLAAAPGWLIDLAQRIPSPPSLPTSPPLRLISSERSGSYGRAALEQEIAALSQAAKGSRNDTLNRASFRLYQLVAGGELDGDEVEQRLIEAAHANGLISDPDDGPAKVRATIRSAADAAKRYPRNRRGRK